MHEPPPPSWDDLRFALAAARTAGFGRAARKLGVQQSTVSRRVAALEKRLGGPLFDRTAGGLVTTWLGQQVRVQAEAIEAAVVKAEDAASAVDDVFGVVRVALTETMAAAIVVPTVLPALLADHPRLVVELVVGDAAADLARREADIAVRFFLTPRGDLLTKRVARLETAVVAAPKLARSLARLDPATWPFIGVRVPGATRPPEEVWRSGWSAPPRLVTNSFHTQAEAVRAGLGVAVLPTSLGALWGLTTLPTPQQPAPPSLELHLVTPRALRKIRRVAVVFTALESALSALSAS